MFVLGNSSLVRRRIGYFAEWTLLVAHARLVRFGSRDMQIFVSLNGSVIFGIVTTHFLEMSI